MGFIANTSPESCEKLTARLLWRPDGDTGYRDAGEVPEYADATSVSLGVTMRASRDARHVNDERVESRHEAWTFALYDHDPDHEALIRMATRNANVSQTQAEAATVSLTTIQKGYWHDLGVYLAGNVTVSGSSSGALAEGDDYDLDAPNGRLQVLSDGDCVEGETLTVTLDKPALSLESYTSQQDTAIYGQFIIEESNGFADMWLRRISFTGRLNVTEFPSHTGPFGRYRVKVTPSEPVAVRKRETFDSLPTVPSDTAGMSSSSTSRSSSSSAVSTSQSSSSS